MNAREYLQHLNSIVKSKQVINPSDWADYAVILAALRLEETDALWDMQQTLAKNHEQITEEGNLSVAKSEIIIKATDYYKDYQKQKSLIECIDETINAVKLRSRALSGELAAIV